MPPTPAASSTRSPASAVAADVRVLADVVVFLGESRAEAEDRKARLDDLFGHRYRSDALVFVGTPAELADVVEEWSGAGIDGFRLRPAGLPHDTRPDRRRSRAPAAAPVAVPGRAPIRHAPRPLRVEPPGQPLRLGGGGTMSDPRQVHLAAHFPGVNNTTVWSDPEAGSHIEFGSFVHMARAAERAKFDFFFLAEGLRLREQGGQIYDLDVMGRPDTFTVLSALAAVTDRLGLAGTINSTFNEPYEVARQFATLDHLSGGRSAWNVVTSWDAFTGENFRRGGFLPQDQRYRRAQQFLVTVVELLDSWRGDEIVADKAAGVFLADPARRGVHPPRRAVRHHRAVQRAPRSAGAAGHLPGGRLRRGARVRGGVGRRHLHPAQRLLARAGRSTTTSRGGSPATAGRPTTSWCCRRPPSSSGTATPRRRSCPATSASSR